MRPFIYASTRTLRESRKRALLELLRAELRSSGLVGPPAVHGHLLCAVPTFLRLGKQARGRSDGAS